MPLIDQVVILDVINTKTYWIMNLGGSRPKLGHAFASHESARDHVLYWNQSLNLPYTVNEQGLTLVTLV